MDKLETAFKGSILTKSRGVTNEVPTQVKNQDLVTQRRGQIIEAAVPLFVANGFHKTTTRQIAKAAGFSVGSMYEYVNSKEDILYLVCLSIHDEVERGVTSALDNAESGLMALRQLIREFLMVCNRMAEQIQLMYQVTKSLPSQWKRRVLENEIGITQMIVDALKRIAISEKLEGISDGEFDLLANNITIFGHMWTFRRWYLSQQHSIEEYIQFQTGFVLAAFPVKLPD
jgi:TetR/AcrR family transcriptional regulator, cholesterol catabolism regulator